MIVLAALVPVKLSPNDEPVRFSKPVSVSDPAPPVAWARAAHLTSHARPEGRHSQVIGKAARVDGRVVMAVESATANPERAHTLLAHFAEGHHFTVSLKISLNILTTMKMITNSNKMPAVIARMRNAFSRIFNHFCHAPTPDPTRSDCRLPGMAKSRSVRDEQQIFPVRVVRGRGLMHKCP